MSGVAKPNTPQGGITIDKIAEIQPGMPALMKEVGDRYTQAYYAAKGGNWKLAAYHLNQVRTAFRTAKVTRPKFTEDLNKFDSEYLLPIFKAIQAKDWGKFEEVFMKGIEGSDFFHDKNGYGYIRYVLPNEPSSSLFQGPPENFKRSRGTQAPG
jgi:hypothetical protein